MGRAGHRVQVHSQRWACRPLADLAGGSSARCSVDTQPSAPRVVTAVSRYCAGSGATRTAWPAGLGGAAASGTAGWPSHSPQIGDYLGVGLLPSASPAQSRRSLPRPWHRNSVGNSYPRLEVNSLVPSPSPARPRRSVPGPCSRNRVGSSNPTSMIPCWDGEDRSHRSQNRFVQNLTISVHRHVLWGQGIRACWSSQ